MSTGRAILITLLALALFAVFAWALTHYAGLQGSLLWTAVMGAIAWAIKSNVEQKREHQRLLAESKREHYLRFLEFLEQAIGSDRAGDNSAPVATSPEFISQLRKWSLRLTLIGSDDVVCAWNAARLSGLGDAQGTGNLSVLHSWGLLWLAMRKDSGHSDTKLQISDVLASFVNDIEQHKDQLNG